MRQQHLETCYNGKPAGHLLLSQERTTQNKGLKEEGGNL